MESGTTARSGGQTLPPFESLSTAAANWGYSQAGGSTLGFLKKIETANGDPGLSAHAVAPINEEFAVKERYKSFIRQLPAKNYIQRLVDIYFEEFNQYVPLPARSIIFTDSRKALTTHSIPTSSRLCWPNGTIYLLTFSLRKAPRACLRICGYSLLWSSRSWPSLCLS